MCEPALEVTISLRFEVTVSLEARMAAVVERIEELMAASGDGAALAALLRDASK